MSKPVFTPYPSWSVCYEAEMAAKDKLKGIKRLAFGMFERKEWKDAMAVYMDACEITYTAVRYEMWQLSQKESK